MDDDLYLKTSREKHQESTFVAHDTVGVNNNADISANFKSRGSTSNEDTSIFQRFLHTLMSFFKTMKLIIGAALLASLAAAIPWDTSSLYNPHTYPSTGPFMEGWYTRMVGSNNKSGAVLFGRVLPEDENPRWPLVYIGLLYDDGTSQHTMTSWQATPPPEDVHVVTVARDASLQQTSTFPVKPHFMWEADGIGYYKTNASHSEFDFQFEEVRASGVIRHSHPWSESGHGPEGLLDFAPIIPLVWYVLSPRSDLESFRITQNDGTTVADFDTGFAHMEKNWGNSFPSGWLWSEGINSDGTVAFAFSGGPVDFYGVNIPGRLLGYRNYKKSISVDFRPPLSYATIKHDACNGSANITAWGLGSKLVAQFKSSTSTYDRCIPGPFKNGFAPMCSETYRAAVNITIYRGLFYSEVVDTQYLENVALEFGASFRCEPCHLEL